MRSCYQKQYMMRFAPKPYRLLQPLCRVLCGRVSAMCHLTSYSTSGDSGNKSRSDLLKTVMRIVPQPVVVVTTGQQGGLKRGITCSSFTGISLDPPVVSFAINRPSRMHNLMLETRRFAVHVLTKNQVRYGIHFARPAKDGEDQFADVSHEVDSVGTPIIRDTAAVLLCTYHSVTSIGDHDVWYSEVQHAYHNNTVQQTLEPLLYYARSFRAVGDEAFIQAFEDTTLPFEDWTHEAHIRMAFHYIREHGDERAAPFIKCGIQKYNAQNRDKISRGYHETVTNFYIRMVAYAMNLEEKTEDTFDEFLVKNQWLLDRNLLFDYYSDEKINQEDAKTKFLLPDKKPLPL